jgi:hypothetical protein
MLATSPASAAERLEERRHEVHSEAHYIAGQARAGIPTHRTRGLGGYPGARHVLDLLRYWPTSWLARHGNEAAPNGACAGSTAHLGRSSTTPSISDRAFWTPLLARHFADQRLAEFQFCLSKPSDLSDPDIVIAAQ